MLKKLLLYTFSIISLAGCTSMKSAFTTKKEPANRPTATITEKKEIKFLDEISTPSTTLTTSPEKKKPVVAEPASINALQRNIFFPAETAEAASPLQIKYSVLLNTPAGEIKNTRMFEFIDEWYGTKYRLGGTTKKGIDCSAFSQYLFAAVYCISLPRTAREQYKLTDRISRTELKEGDLIFFNTRGGVSHVGVYLQNNKFVHAAASGGVMISDVFDSYWVRRFIGVGRLKEQQIIAGGQ